MSWIQFESGREKDAARNALRESREEILRKAEADYHKKQKRIEQSALRGDDKWMLPSVESKIAGDKKSAKKSRKKEKKDKKAKKKKKKRCSESDSSSSSSEEEQWVEKTEPCRGEPASSTVRTEPAIRDEWMNLPGLFPCVNRTDDKRLKTAEKKDKLNKSCIDDLGKSERELNPYWKNGGTGLPQAENSDANSCNSMDPKWLIKSLQRAKEQAVEQGRSLEDVVAERWGSLARLECLIADAETRTRKSFDSKRRYHVEAERGDRPCRERRNRSGDRSKERSEKEPRSRSKSRERRASSKEGRGQSSGGESYHRRRRSRSREGYDDFRQRRPAFKKPDHDADYSNTASTSKSGSYSGSRNWKKPEARKTEVRNESEPRRSKSSSASEDDIDPEPIAKEEEIMTEAEMNRLGAQIVKCEIMGNDDLAIELKLKLEKARETRKNAPAKRPADPEEAAVILTKTDARGMTRPVEPRSEYGEPKGGRNKKKKTDTHEGGQRVRYFADDDKYSIKEMFQQEKGRSTNEDDAMFTKIASKHMDMDEMFEDKVRFEEKDAQRDERDRSRAIAQHKKMTKSLDNCRWCIDSKQMLKHMIVAMGSKVYMSLPSHASLTTDHCILAPIHHVTCQTQCDEDIWEELQNFRKALTKMFMDQEQDVVFFETSMSHRKFPHMQLECVPMPKEVGDLAPIYFKKALLECETEWSTNKKVIDLSSKNVRRSVPKGLPYFAVDFGMQGGFAHVIEDEEMFPKNFAQEIIGGMLDLDRNSWRKPKRENFDQQRAKVMEFAKTWKKYDFTTGDDSD